MRAHIERDILISETLKDVNGRKMIGDANVYVTDGHISFEVLHSGGYIEPAFNINTEAHSSKPEQVFAVFRYSVILSFADALMYFRGNISASVIISYLST